jgi:hypothetical protein
MKESLLYTKCTHIPVFNIFFLLQVEGYFTARKTPGLFDSGFFRTFLSCLMDEMMKRFDPALVLRFSTIKDFRLGCNISCTSYKNIWYYNKLKAKLRK